MESPFQRQSRQRKLIYAALILVLFTGSLFYRPYVLEAQANRLALREQNQGEVDLGGAAVRLSLTGSRGLALCVMWNMAMEMQKEHEWNDLDLLVRSITRLEPHFLTPWLFQSWNLAYNVSAECDRVRDKYFYVSRGIELLAEGDRQNRNNPDLRFALGYYYQDKMGISDQADTFRSLFQLSCIRLVDSSQEDPDLRDDRDPRRLRPKGKVDRKRFESFCRKHPLLVRRLRETLHCATPDDVIDFLADNREVPSLYPQYANETPFPVLPPRPTAAIDDSFDNYFAAGLWYLYSQEPLPLPTPIPGPSLRQSDDPTRRVPRAPALIIFRDYPYKALTFQAERLQQEGWFDLGWEVDEGLSGSDRWFPHQVVLAEGKELSRQAWEKAYDGWRAHGVSNGLYWEPNEYDARQELARLYRETYGLAVGERGPPPRSQDNRGEMRASFDAQQQLFWYHSNRQVTNFPHFLIQSQIESRPEAVKGRRLFFQAERQRKRLADEESLRLYEEGLAIWKGILKRFADYRRENDTQEEAYRWQQQYLKLLLQRKGMLKETELKQLLVVQELLGQSAVRTPGAPWAFLPMQLAPVSRVPVGIQGPFHDTGDDGGPLLTPEGINFAISRMRVNEHQK